MKRIIYALMMVLALFCAIGTIGALECEHIGFGQAVLQMLACVLVEWWALKKL